MLQLCSILYHRFIIMSVFFQKKCLKFNDFREIIIIWTKKTKCFSFLRKKRGSRSFFWFKEAVKTFDLKFLQKHCCVKIVQ